MEGATLIWDSEAPAEIEPREQYLAEYQPRDPKQEKFRGWNILVDTLWIADEDEAHPGEWMFAVRDYDMIKAGIRGVALGDIQSLMYVGVAPPPPHVEDEIND